MLNTVLSWNYNRDVNTIEFEYSRVLNMPWILNMFGFQICQGSWYNEKRLVLEQATLIFEMGLFVNFVSVLKQKLTILYFRYL